MRISHHVLTGGIACALLGAFVVHGIDAQGNKHDPAADWPTYNRDLAGTRYSPLTQIDTTNVATLREAWTYRLRPEPGRSVEAARGVTERSP